MCLNDFGGKFMCSLIHDLQSRSRWGSLVFSNLAYLILAVRLIRGFLKWNPVSLLAWQNDIKTEVILFSESTQSEIRITSIFRSFCRANRISFRKTSIVQVWLKFSNPYDKSERVFQFWVKLAKILWGQTISKQPIILKGQTNHIKSHHFWMGV